MVSIEEYLKDPCGTSSLPYWKTKEVSVPDNVSVIHHRDFDKVEHRESTDTPFFRLIHPLDDLLIPKLPSGFSICDIQLREYAEHINKCYQDIGTSEEELVRYTKRRVYDPSLWIAIKENATGTIVATGIGELDSECGEGILEWIQVSEPYRRLGLGAYVVRALLKRMAAKARFATVSGKCDDPSQPEKLYRKCGFTGNDIWHILWKK